MKPLVRICLAIIAGLSVFSVRAAHQPLHISKYNIQAGMVSNEVNVIMQDSRGFIWLGTENGLSRFDGYEFMHFRSNYKDPDFLTSNTILDICEDGQSRLWLATAKGVSVFDPRTHSVLKIPIPGTGSPRVNALELVGDKTVLIGSVQGLYVYDIPSGSCTKYLKDSRGREASFGGIRDLYTDSRGDIWVSMWRKGVALLDWKRNEIRDLSALKLPDGISVNRVREDFRGNLCIATWGDGLIRIDTASAGGSIRTTTLKHPTSDPHHLDRNIIYDIAFDPNGDYWLGTPGGLRIVTPHGQGFRESEPGMETNALKLHEVRCIFPDNNGNKWLSDFGSGLISTQKHDTAIQEVDLRHHGLSFSIVTGIYRFSDKELWLGVMGVGMVRFDLQNRTIVGATSPILREINRESNAIVGFAAVPGEDKVFIATRYYGVYELTVGKDEIKSMRHLSLRDEFRNDFTNTLIRDRSENIWVGTRGGVAILRHDPLRRTHSLAEVPAINALLGIANVECLLIDSKDRMWVGCKETGLYRFRYRIETAKVTESSHYHVEAGTINNNKIEVVYEDSKNRIWAGTSGGGLALYNEKQDRFDIIDKMQFVASDIICSITEDKRGNLWLSTGNGIVCYDPQSGSIRSYGTGNGYHNISFINESVLNTGDRIIFGGYDGLSIFEPDKLLEKAQMAAPSIVDIRIFNESVNQFDSARRATMTDNMPPYTQKLTLSHKNHSVSIHFAAPNCGNNAMNQYSYILEGVDKNWNYATSSQRAVTYTNLTPGSYTFYVRAGNNRGDWTETPAKLEITVLPPLWATGWAYFVYTLLIAASLFLAVRTVRNRIRLRHALKIEQIERVKSEEVNNAKLTFFTNVSHELFTPITIIATSLEKIVENDDRNSPMVLIIKSNLNRLMRLLQQVMEFRKADSANLKLRVSESDVVMFVKRMCDENFAPLVSKRNIRLIFTSGIESLSGYFDTDKLDKIVYNLLSNAFKYNRQDGKVFVHVSASESEGVRQAVITVRDTGNGIAPEQLPQLFKRFYEGDYRKFDTKGTGIGLSLTKDLVTLHNGRIEVESHVGQGTQFTVTIPIDRSAYTEQQIDSTVAPNQEPLPGNTIPAMAEQPHDGEKYSLLLVEDNEELLFVMQQILSPRYNIHTARNGREALEVLGAKDVDLVVTDYVMPEMDGVELTTRIRGDIELSHLPVVMLSARREVEDKLCSFNAGVDSYVSKPFDIKLLAAQVDGIITNRRRLTGTFRQEKRLTTDSIINTDIDKQFIDRVVNLIGEHIADPDFDITAFNDAMNMSNSTLYRKIKSITGMPPKEFIRNVRFKTACKLLLESSTNISEVAFMVGFTDAKYFSLSFKKEFGITPREYIRQNK